MLSYLAVTVYEWIALAFWTLHLLHRPNLGGLRVGKGISVDAFGIVTVNAPKILDNLTFNGTQTSFTLKSGNVAISPPLPSDLLIFVGGVAQTQGSYNLVSSDIVFSEVPPANATFYGILLYY